MTSLREQRARADLRSDEDYRAAKESYELHVPPHGSDGRSYGVIVFISANDSGRPPADWYPALTEHRFIWVGPNRVGNSRVVTTRVGLAVDAAHAVLEKYSVDRSRVIVSGMSGGAKSALRALFMYPELFAGGLFFCGADYFRDVPTSDGRYWPARFSRPRNLSTSRLRPMAFITGTRDFNQRHVGAVVAAMKRDGFRVEKHVIDGLSHRLPNGALLDRLLNRLLRRL